MNQIKCPNCGEVFTIDESSYDSIVKQIRDHQFAEELYQREKEYEEKLKIQLDIERQRTLNENQKALSEKDVEIQKLKTELSGKEQEGNFQENVHAMQSKKISRHIQTKNFWMTAFLCVTVRASRRSTAAFCGGSVPAQMHPGARRSLSVTTP